MPHQLQPSFKSFTHPYNQLNFCFALSKIVNFISTGIVSDLTFYYLGTARVPFVL